MKAILLILGILLVACGNESMQEAAQDGSGNTGAQSSAPPSSQFTPGQESSDSTVSGPETPSTASPPDVEPRDDITDAKDLAWSSYERVTARQLRFHFAAGSPECFGIRVVVEETYDVVRVGLQQGELSSAPRPCPALGLIGSVLVDLDSPLGSRRVEPLSGRAED